MEANSKNLVLWKNDPLLFFLKGRLGLGGLSITLLLTVIAACILFGIGWIADSSYTGDGIRFIEPRNYYGIAVLVFFLSPLLLGFYVWQSEALSNVLQDFEQANVIQSISKIGSQHVKSYSDFIVQLQMAVDRKSWAIVALMLTIGVLTNEVLIVFPSQIKAAGRSFFWYDVTWYLVLFLLAASVWLYATWMMILKQVQAILYFNRLFQWFEVKIHPMHPDEAGGLGALGQFTIKTSALLVALGLGLAVYTIVCWLVGVNPFSRLDFVLAWALYILITPLSLVLPMLSAHRAMEQAKAIRLNEIAQAFGQTLSSSQLTEDSDAQSIKQANEKLKELQTRYDIVAKTLPAWPVPARLFRNFSITASLPMVSGLVSTVIKFATG